MSMCWRIRLFASRCIRKDDFIADISRLLCWEEFENLPVMMIVAAQICSKVSSKKLGSPHLCLMLDLELTMATGLNEHGLPMNANRSRLLLPSAPSSVIQAPFY